MARSPDRTQRRRNPDKFGITLGTAISEIGVLMDDAIDFKSSELEEEWALAERYYNGYTDLEEFENRSNVTKTEVRDAIRNTMPSVMRILLQSRTPVAYMPSSSTHAPWIEQQGHYVNDLFKKNGGYMVLYASILESLKLKLGPIKTFWEPDPLPEYFKYTKVPFNVVDELMNDPLIELDGFEAVGPQLGSEIELYDVWGYKIHENGKIVIESTPNYEFFISRNCNSVEEAIRRGIHGQQQIVTVAEALDMGLDYDDWIKLDAEDPELSEHTSSSSERKGYTKDPPDDPSSDDLLRHEFLLSEAYVSYDLRGKGRPQLYRFYLGGTSYEYIDHEEVEDSPFSLVNPIPIPHNPYGHSLADLTINEQDTGSSLLRAAIDNAHAANDAKIAADPTKTNFDDLMNPALNAPIRKRAGDTLQVIQIPFTGQGTLGLLEYLDRDVQNKVGITKAAQGLDPDSMQSTDKDAVLNTIMTSQGQTELIVRNIIETALIRVFRILLKLSIRHMSPIQQMSVKGNFIPIDTRMFDPDAAAEPNVGLGTASPMQKQAALTMVLERQEMYMEKFGPNNPFTSYSQVYNTLEDILEANNIHNVHRYFNVVTPDVEKEWAAQQEKQREEAAKIQQANQPMDPSKAYIEVEAGKRQVESSRYMLEARTNERKLELQATVESEKNDIDRDRLVQERVLKLVELGTDAENERIKEEQKENDKAKISVSSGSSGGSSKASGKS